MTAFIIINLVKILTMENVELLINLYRIHSLLTDDEEKNIIKELILKRKMPFLLDSKDKITITKLSNARMGVNRIFNKIICDYFDNSYEEHVGYWKKDHWLFATEQYKELVLIRANFYNNSNSIFKKNGLELLNIYTEEKIHLLIKKHYKL